MSYTLDVSLALGAANTGLTLEAQLVDTAGTNVGAAVTTGFVEFGATGNYLWHYAAWPDSHRGGVKFQVSPGGAVKAFAAINPQEAEFTDVKTSTRSSHAAADVWAVATRELTGFGALVSQIAAAVWAFTPRTLTAFGTLAVDLAAAVWAYATRTLTQSAAQVAAILSGSDITLLRGDTATIVLTGLGSLAGNTKLYFTVKASSGAEDEDAILQVERTQGLLYLNGEVATASDAALVVDDEDAGDITITLAADAMAAVAVKRGMIYDVQKVTGAVVTTMTAANFEVTADATRVTS